jgi:hypothetical protein
MTEQEWLTATNPFDLLSHINDKMTERKLRLFACSCCRKVWSLLTDERVKRLLLTSELFADGMATSQELESAIRASVEFEQENQDEDLPAAYAVINASTEGYIDAGEVCDKLSDAFFSQLPVNKESFEANQKEVGRRMAELSVHAHDIFGNPFRPVSFLPEWRTSTVLALATGIYEEKAFDRMPILADALMDAGCSNEDILSHCRGPGPHTRGCWCVDLILGKG